MLEVCRVNQVEKDITNDQDTKSSIQSEAKANRQDQQENDRVLRISYRQGTRGDRTMHLLGMLAILFYVSKVIDQVNATCGKAEQHKPTDRFK